MSSHWIRVGSNPVTGVLIRRKFGCRLRHAGGEYHVTVQAFYSDASAVQGTPGIAGNPQKLGKDKEAFSL